MKVRTGRVVWEVELGVGGGGGGWGGGGRGGEVRDSERTTLKDGGQRTGMKYRCHCYHLYFAPFRRLCVREA